MSEKPLHSIEFVKAVKNGNNTVIEEFASRVIPRIIEYLMVTLNANRFLAEECTHHAFSVVLERINKDSLDSSTSIVSYTMTTARNEYFRMIKNEFREGAAIFQEQYFLESEEQIDHLIDKEREKILQKCLGSLDVKSRDFIEYLIAHPEYSMMKIGKIFSISPENARTRKSRIVSQLSECVEKKLNK
ncbi:MAG TPA: sigma-70 family RNA polymerase sigma factor [Bacteroidetes bacterium]|nr:sigma-70 family RNA polymerase sigma factor [Bacteroidota bacterium]